MHIPNAIGGKAIPVPYTRGKIRIPHNKTLVSASRNKGLGETIMCRSLGPHVKA